MAFTRYSVWTQHGVPMVISHLLVRYLLTLLFHSTTTCSSASYKWHMLWSYCKFDIFLQLKESEPVRTSQGWPRSTPKWVCFFLNRGFLSFMMEARCPWDTGVLLYSAKSMVDHSTAGEMHILLSFIQNIVQKSCVSGFYTGTVNWYFNYNLLKKKKIIYIRTNYNITEYLHRIKS